MEEKKEETRVFGEASGGINTTRKADKSLGEGKRGMTCAGLQGQSNAFTAQKF